jgi:Spy/CpxP family protein refolding chaperone
MYPGMIAWWRSARHGGGCGASAGCGPEGGGRGGGERHGWNRGVNFGGGGDHDGHDGDFSGGSFGVRRPLRFLAWKLELNDNQVAELARILNDLKTERAQAAVDNRRTTAAFADLVAGESLDEAKLGEAATERVKSAERLRDAVVKAIAKIHGVLDAEQRTRFAYLIRTGALII